ncbi:MAG TPA: ABC transporter substrate-binding protein, partial [Alphaproteobacteria bacterium]|nr:ABC transporter substrate-binding protein [Alphaproteobacteria bacterium]
MKLRVVLGGALAGAALALGAASAFAAEKVTVGALRFVSSAPLFIAADKGYFAEEGLDVDLRFFNAAQPIAVAIASGDADFGVTAFTGGFFNLAGKGALQVIAAQLHEKEGFDGSAILASNAAYDAGLTSVEDLPGHTFAISTVGSSFHYMIAKIAEDVGFAPDEVEMKPLQSVGNMIGAIKSGQVDSMIIVPHIAKPLAEAGAAKIIGWVADYVPYQVGGLFTSTRNVEETPDTVEKFVRAYQRGVADYREAFIEGDENRDEIVRLIHNYVYSDQPADEAYPKIVNGAMYIEAEAKLDVADVYDQV